MSKDSYPMSMELQPSFLLLHMARHDQNFPFLRMTRTSMTPLQTRHPPYLFLRHRLPTVLQVLIRDFVASPTTNFETLSWSVFVCVS